MGWTDIKRKYDGGGASATQSTEDMAARRVLRTLGLTEKALPAAERAAGLDVKRQADTTLLERASAMAERSGHRALWPLPPVRDVKSEKEAEDVLLELAEQHGADLIRPVALVYRLKGSQDLRAKTWLGDIEYLDLARFPMPCRLYRSRDGSCVLGDCDAQVLYDSLAGKLQGKGAENG